MLPVLDRKPGIPVSNADQRCAWRPPRHCEAHLARRPTNAQSKLQVATAYPQQLSKGSSQVLKDLLQFLEGMSGRKLCNSYTGDETWVYIDDPRTSMWMGGDVATPIVPRRTTGTRGACSGSSLPGLILVMLPPGQSFDRDFCVDNVLPKIIDDRALGRPKLKACGTFLHLEDRGPHIWDSHLTSQKGRRLHSGRPDDRVSESELQCQSIGVQ
jgi:hypothetical protein